MEKQIIITYNWKCDDLTEIPVKHREQLETDAHNRIYPMLMEGYTSGELSTTIRLGQDEVKEEHPEEGLSYSGWFNITMRTL